MPGARPIIGGIALNRWVKPLRARAHRPPALFVVRLGVTRKYDHSGRAEPLDDFGRGHFRGQGDQCHSASAERRQQFDSLLVDLSKLAGVMGSTSLGVEARAFQVQAEVRRARPPGARASPRRQPLA